MSWLSSKGTSHQASQPEFGSQNPPDEKKKKELTPTDHPLVPTGVPWHTDGYTFTHTCMHACMHALKVIKVKKKKT